MTECVIWEGARSMGYGQSRSRARATWTTADAAGTVAEASFGEEQQHPPEVGVRVPPAEAPWVEKAGGGSPALSEPAQLLRLVRLAVAHVGLRRGREGLSLHDRDLLARQREYDPDQATIPF